MTPTPAQAELQRVADRLRKATKALDRAVTFEESAEAAHEHNEALEEAAPLFLAELERLGFVRKAE